MEFTNKTMAVWSDYRQAARAWEQYTPSLRSLRRMRRVCFLLPGMALVVMGIYFAAASSLIPGLLLLLLGIAVLLGSFVQPEASRLRRLDPNRGREVTYCFSQKEISCSAAGREDRIPYTAITHILETAELFLLVCGERGDFLVRKDGLLSGDSAAFGEFLSRQTGRTIYHAD